MELKGPDAADKINNFIYIYILQALCLLLTVQEMLDHQPVQSKTLLA